MTEKICTLCGLTKSLDEYSNSKRGKFGKQSQCKACRNQLAKEYRLKNPEKCRENNHKYKAKKIQRTEIKVEIINNQIKCTICGICKDRENYRRGRQCKSCLSLRDKERRKINADKIKEQKRAYRIANKDKIKKYNEQYRKVNAEKIKQVSNLWYHRNRETINTKRKNLATPIAKRKNAIRAHKWYFNNRQKSLETHKTYRSNNSEKLKVYKCRKNNRKKINQYFRDRKQRDVYFKLSKSLRDRARQAIKNRKNYDSYINLLGCTLNQFECFIESKWQTGMTWSNWSLTGWHLDHVKPIKEFDLNNPEEIKDCFHYTNIQPLFAKENFEKGDKWDEYCDFFWRITI